MPANDIQEAIHQGVDIAFSVADLIGSLFGMTDKSERARQSFVLHTDDSGSVVQLVMSASNELAIQCTGPSTTWAVVVPVTTQDAVQPSPQPMQGLLSSQPLTIQGGTQLTFPKFGNYTRGVMTATQVDMLNASPLGAVCAATTLRSFATNPAQAGAIQTVVLAQTQNSGSTPGELFAMQITSTGVTFFNNDPSNSYSFAATLSTASPVQVFTLATIVAPGQASIDFPAGISAPIIREVTAAVSSMPNAIPTIVASATPGAVPIPSARKRASSGGGGRRPAPKRAA